MMQESMPHTLEANMLRLDGVSAAYGRAQVTYDVALEVGQHAVVALLGRNGAGKTTTLKSCLGLVGYSGKIVLDDTLLSGRSTHDIARSGVAYVPEERGIFARLTVEENLAIARRPGGIWKPEEVFERFARLADRRKAMGDALSGGEQQMLAIARALVAPVRYLLLDEPTEGLAPAIVDGVAEMIGEVREAGVGVLLVEQRLDVCMDLADYIYVLDSGRLVYEGSRADFARAAHVRRDYLSV